MKNIKRSDVVVLSIVYLYVKNNSGNFASLIKKCYLIAKDSFAKKKKQGHIFNQITAIKHTYSNISLTIGPTLQVLNVS